MGETGGLFLFATIRPKPEHFAEARAALDALIPETLGESGCLMFAAFESFSEDGVLHLFEHFADQAALDAHYAQPYTQGVFARYERWLSAPVEVKRLSAISALTRAQF
ncbi:putative quinol monooxygenase [uncultured Tateyamaria sp.]|uniref:putative quinol monooxygenase n=1 Tax=uncultured Tateyamaria sp. TaxID=455651 RepID=UPI002632369E|nr:putative quinol monooxygenase [uncultured Tateyamaria sp.]